MAHQSNKLQSMSWQSIQSIYAILGQRLEEYNGIKKRLGVPDTMDIHLSDNDNVFIVRFWRDVNQVNGHLKALDAEIARRNTLIGVMG